MTDTEKENGNATGHRTSFLYHNLELSNFSSQINIFGQLRSDGRLTTDEQKRHINNNLCIYCSNKSHRVEVFLLHLFETTRF